MARDSYVEPWLDLNATHLDAAGAGTPAGASRCGPVGARGARHFGEVRCPLAPSRRKVLVNDTANDLVCVPKLIDASPLPTLDPDAGKWPSAADPDALAVSSSRDDSFTMAYVRRGRAGDLARPAPVRSRFASPLLEPRAGAWTEENGAMASRCYGPRRRPGSWC